jgi:DNA-binding NarL/FixJ family response regulator
MRQGTARTATPAQLLERAGELEAVRRAVDDARGRAGALVLFEGPAGAGKSALLDAARATAEDAGLLVRRARGAELEREFAFGVVRQLFDDVVRDPELRNGDVFAGAARFTASLLDVEDAPAPPREDPFAARHSFYWLAANLSERQPLAIVVDDCHWADAESLAVLAHIANRVEGLPVVLFLGTRTEERIDGVEALRQLAAARGGEFALAPLGEEAAASVVRTFQSSANDVLCRECHAASGGNPFLLNELARALETRELDPAAVLDATPERVTREVANRLGRLSPDAQALARGAAVLGVDVPLRQAAQLAGLDERGSVQAADELVAASVFRTIHPIDFLHPLIRAAVYAGLGPAMKGQDHARAARLLADDGAAPERVAAQLLRCAPVGDAWVCDRLLEAARRASDRGGSGAAVAYLRRALEEPPAAGQRKEVLLELGAAEARVLDAPAAVAHLREALSLGLEEEQRFATVMMLSGVLGQTAHAIEAVDLLEEELARLADEPKLRSMAEAALVNLTRVDPATRPRSAELTARLRRRVEAGEEDDPWVLGAIAAEMGTAGAPSDVLGRVSEAASSVSPNTATAAGWSGWNAIRGLVGAERYEPALRALDRELDRARAAGALLDTGSVFTFRGELYLQQGDLAAAEVDARSLGEVSAACGWPFGEAFSLAWLTEVLVARGELEEADGMFAGGPFGDSAELVPNVYPTPWVLLARGRLRLAQGRLDGAIADLRESGRRATGLGFENPTLLPWRSQLAHALADAGQTAEAGRLAAEELERARSCGSPRVVGVALRAVARAEEGDAAVALLRESADTLDRSDAVLERARAYHDLGAALRQVPAVDEARERLRLAVELAHRCGASLLEDQALEELRATGARPRRRMTSGAGALTPSERRIAQLAADGRTNREIAESLFVSVATVEFHLRNAYRKLEIASRADLPAMLSA